MSEPQISEGVVRRVTHETPHLEAVVLEVSAEVAARYARPGQVVAFQPADDPEGKPLYVALASKPGEARALEVLLGPAAAARLEVREGAAWRFSGPFGAGYPLEAARGKDVLVFAVGSALAPLRPLIWTILEDREAFGALTLYVGAHTEADFPYREDLDAWADAGVRIERALSKPWVQDIFRSNPPKLDDAFAFVCGMPAMIEGVTLALTEHGLPADRVGKNW